MQDGCKIYVESAQEALDTTLMAYKISETMMFYFHQWQVCLDGIYLTHTVEPVEIPTQEDADKFYLHMFQTCFLDPNEPSVYRHIS